MSPDINHGYPGYEQELDALHASYGSESFVRSILQVYSRDCPMALGRLMATIHAGDTEAARNALHSVANIMGVVGPASSQSMIERISADLKAGNPEAAARHAKDLDAVVQAMLVSIQVWLDHPPRDEVSGDRVSKGRS